MALAMCATEEFGSTVSARRRAFSAAATLPLFKKQIRRSKVETNVVLFGISLELFLCGTNVFLASHRFSQNDNGIAIVRQFAPAL